MSGDTEAGRRGPVFITERVVGASHRRAKLPCQDAAAGAARGEALTVAVADGHGTSIHGDLGAEVAVEVALAALLDFADGLGARGERLAEVQGYAEHPLRVQLARAWVARVLERSGDEATSLAAYGTTLVFALETPSFLLLGQIGDGDVLLVDSDGIVSVPLPRDPAAFGDETPSLCMDQAAQWIRVRALPPPKGPALLIACTDGYANSYATSDDFHAIGPGYLALVRERGLDAVAGHLPGFLERVTAGGSGDDIAVALVWWPPAAEAAEIPARAGGGDDDGLPENE
ncbi:MAG: protein phosphatase 2C domain-containing protein [Myxococcales bacterium]|nr:protein phosphatase 2C domain-containing protein [Myxococcales bacterium]